MISLCSAASVSQRFIDRGHVALAIGIAVNTAVFTAYKTLVVRQSDAWEQRTIAGGIPR